MKNDQDGKECKYCMTVISRRARICPQCGRSLSRFAGVYGFVRTGAWLVTAAVSLAFAALEKIDNLGLTSQLHETANQVIGKEAQVETLREAVEALATTEGEAPGVDAATAPDFAPPTSAYMPSPRVTMGAAPPPSPEVAKEKVSEIKKEIAEQLDKPKVDRARIKELERERLEHEFGLRLRER